MADTDLAENEEEPGTAATYEWSAYYNDEGRLYYYNSVTEESSWEQPEEGFNPPPEQEEVPIEAGAEETAASEAATLNDAETDEGVAAAPAEANDDQMDTDGKAPEADAGASVAWVAYKGDDGQEYYFNTVTNETQWEKPDGYVIPAEELQEEDDRGDAAEPSQEREDAVESMETEPTASEPAQVEVEPVEEEPVIDPEVKRVQDAEHALSLTDSILEPGCMANVTELVTSEGGNPQKAITALIDSYHGQTSICGLLASWLAEIRPREMKESSEPSAEAADKIREVATSVIYKIAKERFCKETGDSILNLSKSEAAFLEEMMDSPRWRKLLIDLSATHKDSAVLVYCLRAISKRGHNREIAKRVNQSEHFSVFNAMLLSELAIIGGLAISGGSDATSAVGLDELVSDLRRACSSTSYTYLYSVELLRYLQGKIRREINPSATDRFGRVRRKWEALAQDLESEMMDPCAPSYASVSSPLFRRRRLEVALTISDLHQRQRKRRRFKDRIEVVNSESRQESALETALLEFLRRHATGIQVNDAVLDRLLPRGLDLTTAAVTGRLLIEHPLSIRALLGYLYKPGAGRVTAPIVRNKCARLVAIGVLAAESAAIEEEEGDSGKEVSSESDEVALTRMILEGSQLCEQLESMVSFLVTTGPMNDSASASSPGQKLCSLALKYACVAQGVMMWAREFTRGSEFAASASFPTLSVSVLSLVRLVCTEQAFTRRVALDIALVFLKHANPDVSYQTVSAIKEQSLRLLIVLLTKGEVVPVFGAIASRLQGQGSSELDASLTRYFIGGVLEVVQPPVSVVFVRSFAAVLKSPRCLDAVRSSYFGDPHRPRLVELLESFKGIRANTEGKSLEAADVSLINSLNELLV